MKIEIAGNLYIGKTMMLKKYYGHQQTTYAS